MNLRKKLVLRKLMSDVSFDHNFQNNFFLTLKNIKQTKIKIIMEVQGHTTE